MLPRFYNPDHYGHRKNSEPAKIVQTLDEIENEFGGTFLTIFLNDIPITGSGIDPKTRRSFKDSHRSVWISAKKNDETIGKLAQFKEKWKDRFEQEDIMLYYITIDAL